MVTHESTGPGALALFAAPLAWFLELTCGYTLAAAPCFHTDHRLLAPDPQWAWTQSGLLALAALCVLLALWSFLVCAAALRRQSGAASTQAGNRPLFAALWGAAFGGGFFVATLLTGVGLVLLPRCGG